MRQMHKGHKPYACDHTGCNYRTAHSGHLNRHRRKHDPAAMRACGHPDCNYRTAHSGHLTVHRRKHNPEDHLPCDYPDCGYRTAYSEHLTEHRRKHDPATMLACNHPDCNYTTAWQGNLNRHRMKKHPVAQPVFENPRVLPVRGADQIPARVIKQERPDSPEFQRTLKRRIEDDGPILRDPANPSESVMGQAERPAEELRVTRWGGLQPDAATKRRINDDIQEWLKDEGRHAARFAKMLYVMRPLDDGPERGDSVFARVTLLPFTVLGPYAGILHDDVRQPSLSAERRKAGTSNVHRYAFQTLSAKRLVSAYTSGNILSLVNTANLTGHAPIAGKQNNVSCITVGKNITFYVTNTYIPEGDELFIDYGPDYESGPNVKRLKQEAEESPGCSSRSDKT
ncbi:hypothetical protein SHA53_004478 [Salmonella enterica]|nr:hypothetical protein [Salmonella enterica]